MSKIVLLLSFIISFSISAKGLQYIDSRSLDKVERSNLVEAYKDFLVALEQKEGIQDSRLYSNSIFEKIINNFQAYADQINDCIYAGWPSVRASNGFCNRPETTAGYKDFDLLVSEYGFSDGKPEGYQSCKADERRCNPVIFGPVCTPFDTKYNRVRATSNCDKISNAQFPNGFDYKTYLELNIEEKDLEKIESKLDSQFDEVQKTAYSVCTDPNKKQSRTAVCRVLEQRLGQDFPYHRDQVRPGGRRSNNGGGSRGKPSNQYPRTEESLTEIENKIGALNLEINKQLVSDECTDPSVARVVNKRYNTIQLMDPKSGEFLSDEGNECIKKLKPLLDQRAVLLEEYENIINELTPHANSCGVDDPVNDLNAIEKQITDMNTLVAEKACEDRPVEWTAKGCAGDFACAIGSTLFYGGPMDKLGAVVGKQLGFGEDCLNSQNNCMAKIATAAADVVWSFLQSIPDLANMAWDGIKWVGKKVYSWMPWVSDTEEKLSDANQAAMNVLEEDEKSTLEKIGNFFKEMWTMIKEYITHDLMCTEPGWELERFEKDAHCSQPFVSWKCLSCAGAISGVCNVIGAVGSEVIIGVLTGGTATAAKAGVKAVSVGVKTAARVMLKSQMKGLAGTAIRTTAKVGIKTAKVVRAPFTLAKSSAGKARVFLKGEGKRFVQVSSWAQRNANKLYTPIRPKNIIVRNAVELTGKGIQKGAQKVGKVGKNIVLAPFKLPGKALKVVGRVLDPFKLGEAGFALGFNAVNGMLPMTRFLRMTEMSHDIAKAVEGINSAKNAQAAVDKSMRLFNTANKQMDEWVKLAQKGELTAEEFRQLEKIIDIQKYLKTKYAANSKAIERLKDIEKSFNNKQKDLFETLGEKGLSRFGEYVKPEYTGLTKNKIRNLKTGTEKNITSVEVLKKNSFDIVIKTKPNNQSILIVDRVDGQLVGFTRGGEKVLISSGSLSKDANRFIAKKLNLKPVNARFDETQNLLKRGGKTKISNRIKNTSSSEEIAAKEFKSQTKFLESVSKAKTNYKLNKVAREIKAIDKASLKASSSNKVTLDRYKEEILSTLPSTKARNIVLNRTRPAITSGSFKGNSNIKVYSKSGNGQVTIKSNIESKLTTRIADDGPYIKLTNGSQSQGVRVIDESKNSFVGYNSKGNIVHIKKSAIPSAESKQISQFVEEIDPRLKRKILSEARKNNSLRVYPKNDPDFLYETQLARSEIRVGDDIVKLRRFQAGGSNINKNLKNGGEITLKDTAGDKLTIKNIREEGNNWIGDTKSGDRVIIPKSLMDSTTNNLLSRGRNFTKFKRNISEKLSFVKRFNKSSKKIDVDAAFKAKYKYINFFLKYNLSQKAINQLDQSTLEKISENVYLRQINESEAEILYTDQEMESFVTEEHQREQAQMEAAIEEAVAADEEYNFEEFNGDIEF